MTNRFGLYFGIGMALLVVGCSLLSIGLWAGSNEVVFSYEPMGHYVVANGSVSKFLEAQTGNKGILYVNTSEFNRISQGSTVYVIHDRDNWKIMVVKGRVAYGLQTPSLEDAHVSVVNGKLTFVRFVETGENYVWLGVFAIMVGLVFCGGASSVVELKD